ncbi:hypothetical protein JTE90_009223 [Oedothorax gibbosus]|uniref:Uncharacterized protein n=1 Tax=Oedothorax gibbosus TaxID=931172 RepID=A0AAV6UQK4_9ARAC|nr:hypothetical protein JTE90_009223 [Oedothorax gibbosus]
MCLTLRCAWSYYAYSSPQSYQPRVIYRHHIAPYQPQATYVHPMHLPPMAHPPMMAYGAPPMSFFGPPPFPPMNYAPAASYQSSYFSRPPPPPPRSPRFPLKEMFTDPLQTAFSQYPSKPNIFNKIKPYLFGGSPNPGPTGFAPEPTGFASGPTHLTGPTGYLTGPTGFPSGPQGPRSLPHHPFYPDYFPPHQFTPNRPLHNRPHHHGYMDSGPQKSCSCSLHVGDLTVYKHTDVRSSYSCDDLKDCNSFCTNLFSSEELRAQTRSDACLILGKDTSVPWFRRDAVCEPHGVKNDTKLSVDLCCKDLQPC